MDDQSQHGYFQMRAEEEREAAANAADERAARSHRELAATYEKLATGNGELTAMEEVPPLPGALPKEFRILP